MNITDIPFGTTDWSTVEVTEHPGTTGKAFWRTKQFGAIRVRLLEYTPGYLADHWRGERPHSALPRGPTRYRARRRSHVHLEAGH